jgi:hypothetical protein
VDKLTRIMHLPPILIQTSTPTLRFKVEAGMFTRQSPEEVKRRAAIDKVLKVLVK